MGEAQRFTTGMDMASSWWRRLGSPTLNALIDLAFAASPTLALARATLRPAEEAQLGQARATPLPRVELIVGSQRQRMSPSAQVQQGDGRTFNWYSAGIGAHYTLDLAGGNRRALVALSARTDYRRYQLEGARLSVAASIANTAITQARLAAQIDAMQAMAQTQEAQLRLARERVRLGQAAHTEARALQTQVEQTRASVPPLRQQQQQDGHLLATLAGQASGAQDVLEFALKDFSLPTELALLIPSALVRQRPDTQGAQALLYAANADYGIAVARLYPRINLNANLVSQALGTGRCLVAALPSGVSSVRLPSRCSTRLCRPTRALPSMQLWPTTRLWYWTHFVPWPTHCAQLKAMLKRWRRWPAQTQQRKRAFCPCSTRTRSARRVIFNC